MDLSKLPSTYYRVSVKALIFNEENKLLVGFMSNEDSKGWEMPGGGLEHGETIQECLERELEEEFGAKIERIGGIKFIYTNKTVRGYPKLNMAVLVQLKSHNFHLKEMSEAKFISKDELRQLDFAADESAIVSQIDQIWPK